MSTALELRHIRKAFGATQVVDGVSLGVAPGEFVALLGPSGCGKSTLLNIIAGFERADSGEVLVDGRRIDNLAPQHRGIGWVPQDFGVFSHLTVAENLDFGLRRRKLAAKERKRRLDTFAERLELTAIWRRRGGALNLSEMQRVALARALITGPAVVLLDEPMSNLDAAIRARLRTELKQIQKEFGQTVLYVTHDQVEAMAMADRIAVMNGGILAQVDAPLDLYRQPAERFVAGFLGEPSMNLLSGRARPRGEGTVLQLDGGGEILIEGGLPVHGAVLLGIRPHQVALRSYPSRFANPVRVDAVEYQGAEEILSLTVSGTELRAIAAAGFAGAEAIVTVVIRARDVLIFDPESGLALRRPAERRAA